MTEKEFNAFKDAWLNYPSQDNEGYVPDRGSFKAGWFAALEWCGYKKSKAENEQLKAKLEKATEVLKEAAEYHNTDDVNGEAGYICWKALKELEESK